MANGIAGVRAILARPEVRQEVARPRRIDHTHDVPYLAGSNSKGGVTYIDRRVPKTLTVRGKSGGKVNIDPSVPLNVHEQTEHAVMVDGGLPYETAHRIALTKEQQAVERQGADWQSYQDAMHRLAATTQSEHPVDPPADLYTKPYPHTEAEFLKREAIPMDHKASGGAVAPSYYLRRGGSVRVLQSGNNGDGVADVQKKLATLGYDVGPTDSAFGNRTEAAVRQFQQDHGLRLVDGRVGPETIGALQAATIPQPRLRPTPTPDSAPASGIASPAQVPAWMPSAGINSAFGSGITPLAKAPTWMPSTGIEPSIPTAQVPAWMPSAGIAPPAPSSDGAGFLGQLFDHTVAKHTASLPQESLMVGDVQREGNKMRAQAGQQVVPGPNGIATSSDPKFAQMMLAATGKRLANPTASPHFANADPSTSTFLPPESVPPQMRMGEEMAPAQGGDTLDPIRSAMIGKVNTAHAISSETAPDQPRPVQFNSSTAGTFDQAAAPHNADVMLGNALVRKAEFEPTRVASGLLSSSVAGRTDRLPIAVPKNAYVVPADVVSGLGQGNTSSGATILDQIFGNHAGSGAGSGMKRGGVASHEQVPILAAGGEYIVHPNAVQNVGMGDFGKGHHVLDNMVTSVRKQTAQRLRALPGPKK